MMAFYGGRLGGQFSDQRETRDQYLGALLGEIARREKGKEAIRNGATP